MVAIFVTLLLIKTSYNNINWAAKKMKPLATTMFSQSGTFYQHFTENISDGSGYRRDVVLWG